MTKQVIGVGTAANDRNGDSLRVAFQKVNANFTELYTSVGADAAGNQLVNGTQIVDLDTAGVLTLPADGVISQNSLRTSTTGYIEVLGGATTVIFDGISSQTGCKLVIRVEGRIDGDGTGTDHTQMCEATIAASYNNTAEPVMSVYGIIYTSVSPLASFTVARGVSNSIEVSAVNSQATNSLHISVQSMQFVSYYD